MKVKVQKTQIAFANRRQFAFVSFLPVRKAKERPEVYIAVTFGLGYRLEFPRVDAAVSRPPDVLPTMSWFPGHGRLIKGVVSGVRAEDIEEPLMREGL